MKRIIGMLAVVLAFAALASGLPTDHSASEPFLASGAAPGYEVIELVRGSPLHGANGLYVGPDGYVYVASVIGQEIIVFDPDTDEIVRRLGPSDGVMGPDDVVFGPDGSLYWTDIMVAEVGRLAPDGTVTKQLVAPGVNPITFNDEGRLFVGLDFLGDGLLELDPELLAPPRPIVVASEEVPYPLGFFNAFDFGPDGRLYGPLYAADMFISLDVDACEATSSPWTDCDLRVVAAGFHTPVAAKFDPQGRLHALDAWTGELFILDIETGEKTLVASLGQGLDNLAFSPSGRLFVSNADDGSLVEVLAEGDVRTISRGGLITPCGVAVLERPDGGESVFVADLWRLWEFDGATGEVIAFTKGSLVGEGLQSVMTAAADGSNLIVSTYFGGVTQVYDPWAAELIEHHATPVPLNAVRLGGDIAVVELMSGGVVWASTLEPILSIDQEQVFLPAGLATDGDRLWVSDWATGIVWQVEFDGTSPLPPVPIASDLANPEGLAFDYDGGLLVVESSAQRLSRINLASGAVEVVAEALALGRQADPSGPPTGPVNGVAVGPSGAIYVTGDIGNVLYRIERR